MYRDEEIAEVITYLEHDKVSLSPAHRDALEKALISPLKLNVEDSPGEFVVAVAAFGNNLLYWSDVEEGWELINVGGQGKIRTRGGNQFKLGHIMNQLFGNSYAA